MLFHETESVELKQDYTESIRKDIIAFANTNGGTVFVGVRDNGEVIGVSSPDQMIQRISNMVRDSIRPDVTMFVHYDPEDADGKRIVKVSVNRGTGRPYYWAEKGMQPSGVYVRQGASAAPATEVSIRQMIKETDGDSYEAMRSLEQGLSFTYASAAFKRNGIEFGEPQIRTLGILSSEGIYTNLGLLLSDQCPHVIKAAVFSGVDQDVFQDRREFTGSLLKQADDAYAFLEMRNEKTATFDGIHRIDHLAYPEAALREALLNAVIHRDYSYSASTLISSYADRIEIISAGGLVRGFSLKDVMMGFSICRNPKLANVFYRLDLIEAYGTGLRKIMNSYPVFAPEKLLQTTDKVFKVTLPRLTVVPRQTGNSRETNEEKVLSFLASTEFITRIDVERLTGLSPASASRLLRRLVDEGELEVMGGGKATRYYDKNCPRHQ